MSETKVEQLEREFDAGKSLLKRRPKLFVCLGLIAFVVLIGYLINEHIVKKALQDDNTKLKSELVSLKETLDDTKRDRDAKATQLAPFLATADLRFPDAPPDKRLELLLQRMEQVVANVQDAARKISPERAIDPQIRRVLVGNLKTTSPLSVVIDCTIGDQEAFSLASQIKGLLEEIGWKVDGISQSIYSKPVKGLVLIFGKTPSPELQSALAPLFDGLGYPREASLDEKLGENGLKIIVGSK